MLINIQPGYSLPWRVVTIKSTTPSRASAVSKSFAGPAPGRKRAGKKRRIAVRKKLQEKREKKLAAQLAEATKEAAEKEKRTRKNREKKLKRREKERSKKAAGAVVTEGEG